MVNFLYGCVSSFFKALLTQRVALYISFPYSTPLVVVTLVTPVTTVVFVVLFYVFFLVLIAVATGRQLITAGVLAGAFRFVGHLLISFWV